LFFLRRRRSPQHVEEEIEKPYQSPSLVEDFPTRSATIAQFNTGISKAQLIMMSEDSGPAAASPSSDSGSRAGETSAASDSGQQQRMRLVPQRAGNLHVTNQASGEEKPLPSPVTPKLQPARRQTEGEDHLRREVEQLRMEVHAMRAAGQPAITEEPPPGYAES
jgi:hypothetical protein